MSDKNLTNPGPDLDALIAEKVMGYKKLYRKDYPQNSGDWHGLEWMWDFKQGELYWKAQECPKYSTDINEAFKIVEKLRHLNPTIHYEDTCGQWSCSANSGLSGKVWSEISDLDGTSSAPHAICLLALRVAGYKLIEPI